METFRRGSSTEIKKAEISSHLEQTLVINPTIAIEMTFYRSDLHGIQMNESASLSLSKPCPP